MDKITVGDRVRRVSTYTMLKREYPTPSYERLLTGVVLADYDLMGRKHEFAGAVEVRWDQGQNSETNVDKSCLELEVQPVSEEELAEVYRLLGVSP